ncbi:MAG: hypothetical protein BWY28_02129 [bacterium ADurb.Bin236]|nr:MAG: hypothetical protein BWY28_02129 [bacterium ADurb.Bin236]HPN94771.1 Ig-like domain-containing protein [bacterium]
MRKLICAIAVAAAALAAGSAALAAGGTLHMFMSEKAVSNVSDPELKRLLERNRDIVLWASWYPDSGYAGGNKYGEYSHWSEFHNGYIDYIRNDIGPSHPEYERLIAHLLGAMAHGFEDQVFDYLLIEKVTEADGGTQDDVDRGLDMVCMGEHGRNELSAAARLKGNPARLTPVSHLEKVYEKLGAPWPDIRRQMISGLRFLYLAYEGTKILHKNESEIVRQKIPWGAANYMQAPGGVEHLGRLTALYWEARWKKLNDIPVGLVFATYPENGATLISRRAGTVDSSINIFFSEKYDQSSITPETVFVAGPDGARIDGAFHWSYGHNMLQFRPSADLPPGSRLDVTVKAAVRDMFGVPMANDYTFHVLAP